MVTIRSTAAALLFTLTAGPGAFAAPTAVAEAFTPPAIASTLSGVVRDDLGRALEGAEVLVLPPEGQARGALLHAMSGAGGRFVVGALAPGVYRVAAIKSGYITALGRVNTWLRSSVDLVLRPVPRDGQPGAEQVLEDLSWTLRVPPRSILRELDAGAVAPAGDTGGARAFADRVQASVRGEVDHVVAMGSWRAGASGPSSSLEGNETRMRLAGALGERGAIQVNGRRGSLDSSSVTSPSALRRGASDVDLDVSYDTAVDQSLAMRAFYSTGDLYVNDQVDRPGRGARQTQRSWGYDARWRKQVGAASRVALQVGFKDANLDPGQSLGIGWDPQRGDAENRAIGAEGSYENFVGDGHLVRLGVRAQRLSLQAPSVRLGREAGRFALDGATGWSLLVDTEDQWTVAGPVVVTYGLAVRQGFDGPDATSLTTRVGGSWTGARSEARAVVSYLAANRAATGPALDNRRAPLGYDVGWKSRLDPTTTFRATAAYVPSQADVWAVDDALRDAETLFVTDGFASDRFVAVELEHAAPSATVYFRVARGRVEGALAPTFDDVPVVLLAERELGYDAARFGVRSPRAGSSFALEYRAIHDDVAPAGALGADELGTFELEFAQDLVRFAGGRASCRLLLTARSALRPGTSVSETDPVDARRFVAGYRRVGAGVSLAF